MRTQQLLCLCLMSLQLFSFLPSAKSETDVASGIEGIVSVSPAHGGPIRVGVPNSRPLVNAEFVVGNDKGAVAEFKTDEQGQFKISVAPGHYSVSLKNKKGGIGRFGPFDVDVVAGQFAKVEWMCDSGMR